MYDHVGGFGHLLIMGQAGFLEHDETVRGIKTFARKVYPRLKETFPDTAISGCVRSATLPSARPLIHETGLISAPVSVYFESFARASPTGRSPVVMVHGGAHSGSCYQRTADGRRGWAYLFAERGYRVVVPDWPGTGRSGYIALDQLDGAAVVAGLGALIRSLGSGVVLLTHSMSGAYGWRLLELHGDIIDSVIGVAPAPPGNIQKTAPVYAETPTMIETEAIGRRVRVDKTAPVVSTADFVERKLVGESRYFPRDRVADYAGSLRPSARALAGAAERAWPPVAREQSTVVGGKAHPGHHRHRRSRPSARARRQHRHLAQRPWCQGRLLFLADRGIVGNGHMLMLERNSDEVAGIILEWLEAAARR